jgi:zinc protease
MLTGDPESLNRLYALYDKVTVKDVKMVANKYFTSNALTIATINEDEEGGLK